jgi:hypothetical protein
MRKKSWASAINPDAPHRAVVQIGGIATRIAAARFKVAVNGSASVKDLIVRYSERACPSASSGVRFMSTPAFARASQFMAVSSLISGRCAGPRPLVRPTAWLG